jgi:N-methylhydantoinase A
MTRYSVAIDIGGTFTDFVLLDEERAVLCTDKVLSTPDRPEEAILRGLEKLSSRTGFALSSARLFLHATTIITNAVIERKGADFILLFTEGFRDVLEIGREHRYNLTNLRLRFPEPVSRRDLRLAVSERVSASGETLRVPDKELVQAGVRSLAEPTGIRNFAICFLHAYRNEANENLVRGWIRELYPDAYISSAATVAPAEREFERWTTCTVNAYTMPLLADYIARLNDALSQRGFSGRALLMTSSGLPMEFDRCVDYPIRMIESGPAAGVLAAKEIANRNAGTPSTPHQAVTGHVLAYDMGGTTAKGAFLSGGEFHVQGKLEVARVGTFEPGSGLPLLIPAIDLIEIGAGGGSIAHLDPRGVIAVGPESAGAIPGPACYGNGGLLPTLTDANVMLGLLNEDNFRSSGIAVRPELAREAIQRMIAEPLGMPAERVAHAVRGTVNENVARAFRVHASELGIDYRRYAMVCTGGSAPLQAAEIARILNIRTVIFPFGAGVSSAFGLFSGAEGITLQRTDVVPLETIDAGQLRTRVDARTGTEPYAMSLVAAGASVELTLGMRYVGQGYDVGVRIDRIDHSDSSSIQKAFEREYRRVFNLIFPSYGIEIFSWTVQIRSATALTHIRQARYENAGTGRLALKGTRSILGQPEPVKVYDRYALQPGDVIEGGAVIEENDTTINLPSFVRAVVQDSFDIVAEIIPQAGRDPHDGHYRSA